jgi:murein DD-endopeptidase MepM/ murein hydrolase activator NlpD
MAAFVAGAVGLVLLGLLFFIGSRTRGPAEGTNAVLGDAGASLAALGDAAADASRDGAAEPVDAGPPAPPAYRIHVLKDDKSLEYIEGKIGKRPFGAAMSHVPLTRPEVARLIKAFDGVHEFTRCQPKDSFILVKNRATSKVVAFEYWATPEELFQATEEGGVLKGKKVLLRVEHKLRTASFIVKDDYKKSLAEAGFADDMVQWTSDALEGHLEVSDIHAGSRVRLAAMEELIEGERTRTSELSAMEYEPEHSTGEPLRVYHYERAHEALKEGEHLRARDKHAGFYDAKGQRPFRGGYRSPVPFARITSRFNPHRMHPVLHVVMPHNGIDFAAQTGTPIYAAAAGVVKSAGDSGPCGNMVQIEHATGIVTAYCHLSKIAPGIHGGTKVETRQLIGYAGATGRVTGPHLHFAAKRGDIFIDPQALRLDGVRVIPPQDRDAFQVRRGELDKLLDGISPPGGVASARDGGAGPSNDDGGADDDDIMDTVDLPDAG